MGKRRYTVDEKKIARYLKEGRGQGEGMHYKPWIRTDEVPSKGRVHRVFCNKTGRIHHLLSDNEYKAFLLLYYNDYVIDIREQYPLLDREAVKYIASTLRIRPPRGVMTIDLIVTWLIAGEKYTTAVDVKESKELKEISVRDLLEISRIYAEEVIGVPWELKTEIDVKTTFTENLDWILYGERSAMQLSMEKVNSFLFWIQRAREVSAKTPVRICCSQFDTTAGYKDAIGLSIFRTLLAGKILEGDLNMPMLQDQPICNFEINLKRYLELV